MARDPLRKWYWYLVDFKEPNKPIVDSTKFKNIDLAYIAIKYLIKKPYVFPERGEVLKRYGYRGSPHFHRLGLVINRKQSYPPAAQMEIERLHRFHPWGYGDKDSVWFEKLDRAFPDTQFYWPDNPLKTPRRNRVDRRRRRVFHYKKLYLRYINEDY